MLLQFYAGVMAKPEGDHLRCIIIELMEDDHFMDHRILTPLHCIKAALRSTKCHDLIKNTETESTFKLERIRAVTPTYTNEMVGVGASGSRSEQQANKARTLCMEKIEKFKGSQPIIFTDGSALGNPGPCGAAIVVYAEGKLSSPVSLKQPISTFSTNYHGELYAIQMALEYVSLCATTRKFNVVYIMSDCQSAIISVCSKKTHENHQDIIDKCQSICSDLANLNIRVELHWVPGHVSLEGNELADQHAKQAARDTENPDIYWPSQKNAKSTIKGAINRGEKALWQRAWDRSNSTLHNIIPKVGTAPTISGGKTSDIRLFRIRAGHTKLNEHMHKLGDNFSASPNCVCDMALQTPVHVIMECPLLNDIRQLLVDDIDLIYARHDTPYWERTVDYNTLIWPSFSNVETTYAVNSAVARYLMKIPFDI